MRSSEPSSSSCSATLVIHSYSTSGQDRGPCLGHTSDKTADVVPDVAEPAIKRLRPRLLGLRLRRLRRHRVLGRGCHRQGLRHRANRNKTANSYIVRIVI